MTISTGKESLKSSRQKEDGSLYPTSEARHQVSPVKPPLSLPRIKEWIRVHHEREKKWPAVTAGQVLDAEGKPTGETWHGIHQAISCGYRGLGDLPKGYSLKKAIDEVSGRQVKADLSVETIKSWIRIFHKREGTWPSVSSGIVADAQGKKTGETWGGINQALGNKYRGLSGVPDGYSLAQLVDEISDRPSKEQLSLERIKEWITLFHERNGKWPNVTSDSVLDAAGKLTGDSWPSIDQALRMGTRGLSEVKNTGYSLKRLVDEVSKRPIKGSLSLDTIMTWITLYHEREQKWPSVSSGEVLDAEGKGTGETWGGIQQALARRLRGLAALPEGYSLAKLVDEVSKRPVKQDLTLEMVKEWIQVFHQREGRWPHERCGMVLDKTGKATRENWKGINSALREGYRGFQKGSSLKELVDEVSGRPPKKDLSLDAIRELVFLFHDREGSWPHEKSGIVLDAHGKETADTWQKVDIALRRGFRGLGGLPEGTSLARLVDEISGRPPQARVQAPVDLDYPIFEELGLGYSAAEERDALRMLIADGTASRRFPSKHSIVRPDGRLSNYLNPEVVGYAQFIKNLRAFLSSRNIQPGKLSALSETEAALLAGVLNVPVSELSSEIEQLDQGEAAFRSFACYERGTTLVKDNDPRRGLKRGNLKAGTATAFAKGEAFEQLVGFALAALYPEELIIPQYCLVADPAKNYIGCRVDFKVGFRLFEVKWGGATENINNTIAKHARHIPPGHEYMVIMLHSNQHVSGSYRLFAEIVSELRSDLRDSFEYLLAVIEEAAQREALHFLEATRDFLYSRVDDLNGVPPKARLDAISAGLESILMLPHDELEEHFTARTARYFNPLEAFYHRDGTLRVSAITLGEYVSEAPEQMKVVYTLDHYEFVSELDRNIALMLECANEGARVNQLLPNQFASLIKEPIFTLRDGRKFSPSALGIRSLEELKTCNSVHFEEEDWSLGLQFISTFLA